MNCFYVVIQNVHGIMAYLDISSSGNLSDPSRVDLNTNIINQSKNCNSIKGHTTVKSAKIKILQIGTHVLTSSPFLTPFFMFHNFEIDVVFLTLHGLGLIKINTVS